MITIYCLKFCGRMFYIGQTKNTTVRLKTHLIANEKLKNMPPKIKSLITIHTIEVCEKKIACQRERYYIKKYRDEGIKLTNISHMVDPINNIKERIKYKRITQEEYDQARKIGFSFIANHLGINPETIRVALIKKRIKSTYYDKIYSSDNALINNSLQSISFPTQK